MPVLELFCTVECDKISDVSVTSRGFSEAIAAVFPKTDIQNYIIHQLRNSSNTFLTRI